MQNVRHTAYHVKKHSKNIWPKVTPTVIKINTNHLCGLHFPPPKNIYKEKIISYNYIKSLKKITILKSHKMLPQKQRIQTKGSPGVANALIACRPNSRVSSLSKCLSAFAPAFAPITLSVLGRSCFK